MKSAGISSNVCCQIWKTTTLLNVMFRKKTTQVLGMWRKCYESVAQGATPNTIGFFCCVCYLVLPVMVIQFIFRVTIWQFSDFWKWKGTYLFGYLTTDWTIYALLHILCMTSAVFVSRYWHRSLNPRKLIEVKFSHLSRHMTMQRTLKLYKLPEVRGTTTPCIHASLLCGVSQYEVHMLK